MKYIWFDIHTGEFSNAWDEKMHKECFKESELEKLFEKGQIKTGSKLIKFECLNDDNFEFSNIMKVITNTNNFGLKK